MEILVAAVLVSMAGLAAVLAIGGTLERTADRSRQAAIALLLAVYGAAIWPLPATPTVTNLAVVAAAAALGYMLGKVLGTSGAIVAFCTTAVAVDLLSFSGGLTRQLLDRAAAGDSSVLQYLALVWPLGGRLTPSSAWRISSSRPPCSAGSAARGIRDGTR